MAVGVLSIGLVGIAIGVASLVAARHLLPRVGIPEEFLEIVRLLVALGAGLAITFGLMLVLLALFLG